MRNRNDFAKIIALKPADPGQGMSALVSVRPGLAPMMAVHARGGYLGFRAEGEALCKFAREILDFFDGGEEE